MTLGIKHPDDEPAIVKITVRHIVESETVTCS